MKQLGKDNPEMLPFWAKAVVRARTWNETKWSSRALEGRIVSPSPDVSRGWCLRAINQGQIFYYVSTLVYTGLKTPEEAPVLEGEPPEDDITPEIIPKATLEVPRRISTKIKPSTSPDSSLHPAAPAPPDSTVAPELLSTPARRITSKSKVSGLIAVENKGRQELVTQFLQHPDLLQLGQGNRKITEQNRNSLYAVFGAFQHGGVVGITRATKDHSDLVRQACQILCQDHPGEVFTSFVVSRNSSMPVHQDRNNDPATCNLISPLCVPSSGGVWVEVQVGDPLMSDDIRYQEYGGKSIFGCVLPVGKPVRVKPNRWHCTADWTADDGDRFLVIGYTIKDWHKLSHQDLQSLEVSGFSVPAHADVSSVQAANLPSQGVEAQTQVPVPQTESVPQGSQAIGLHSTSQVQVHATQVPAVSFAGESADACIVQSHVGDLDLGAQTQVPGQGACISERRAQVHMAVVIPGDGMICSLRILGKGLVKKEGC